MEIKALELDLELDFDYKFRSYNDKKTCMVYNSIDEISDDYHLIRINIFFMFRHEEKDYLNYKYLGGFNHRDSYDLIYINNNFYANGLGIIEDKTDLSYHKLIEIIHYDKKSNSYNTIKCDDLGIDKINFMLPYLVVVSDYYGIEYDLDEVFNIYKILPNLYLFTKKGNMIKKALK